MRYNENKYNDNSVINNRNGFMDRMMINNNPTNKNMNDNINFDMRNNNYNDVDRLSLERMFSSYSKPKTERYSVNNPNKFNDNDKIGEITGGTINCDEGEQKMPMRSQEDLYAFTRKEKVNPYLDFDLYDKKNEEFNVNYNDPYQEYGSNFSDIKQEHRIINNNNNNDNDLVSYINNFGLHVFKSIKKRAIQPCLYSPTNILNFLISLLIGSSGNIHEEIETIIPNKNPSEILRFLETIKTTDEINIMYLPSKYPLNPTYVSMISKICDVSSININDPNINKKINNALSHYTRKNMKNCVTHNKISNSILSVNYMMFHTKWLNFDCEYKTIKINGKIKKFVVGKHTTQRFFSPDMYTRVVELDLEDGCSIGFYEGDINLLEENIKNLKKEVFEKLALPCISTKTEYCTKYNINPILKAIGLDIFNDNEFKNITPKNIKLGNIIQQNMLNIKPSKCEKIKSIGKGLTVIFDKPLICYIKKRDVIVMLCEI